jgi:hypothetical protein
MYSGRKTAQSVTFQYAEWIHRMLQGFAIVPTA